MKIEIKNSDKLGVKFFQEGGAMEPGAEAPVEAAPQEEAAQDPLMQIVQAAAQAVQSQDAQLALQVCQALVEMAQGGGGEPAPAAPEGAAPVYKKGGKFSRWIQK